MGPFDGVSAFDHMTRDQLLLVLEMFAKNWLAHDGCWFLACEERLGLEQAIELDARAWQQFAAVEARRIIDTFHLPADGGLPTLERALSFRMYGLLNRQHTEWSKDRRSFRFVMDVCRVQEARRRKGLAAFPCKPVGTVEFETFARTVDPRIQARCVHCPPDAADGQYCAWEFSVQESARR